MAESQEASNFLISISNTITVFPIERGLFLPLLAHPIERNVR